MTPISSAALISGADEAFGDAVKVFHAGTADEGGQLVTAGGRVLCVTALGDDVKAARDAAYAAAEHIRFDGLTRRSDIGWRAIERYS